MAAYAAEVFCANGVADRVVVVDGWSQQLELAEPAERCRSPIR